jgi:hypothetical protein
LAHIRRLLVSFVTPCNNLSSEMGKWHIVPLILSTLQDLDPVPLL